MIKIFLGIAIVASFVLVGIKIKDDKIFVSDFFEKLKLFNGETSVDISLYHMPIAESLKKLNVSVGGALDGVEKISSGEKFVFKDRRFKKNQREFVEFYVNSLGRADAASETERLKTAAEKLAVLSEESKRSAKAYSTLSLKLSFCVGLVVFIIMI